MSHGRIECGLKSWPCQVILALLGNSRGPLPHTTDTLIHLRVPRTFSTHSSMPRKLCEHSVAPARSFHSVLPARSLHAPAAPCTLAAHSGLFLHTISDSACSGFSILLYVQAQLAPPCALPTFILYDICSLHLAYSPFQALLTHKLACSLPAPSATLLGCTEWLQTITPASNFGSAGFNTKLNRQRMLQCHWYDSGYEWRKTGSG